MVSRKLRNDNDGNKITKDKKMYETVANFIKEIGFPIGVALYLLIIFRKSITENTKAIMELTKYIKNHNGDKK